MVVTLGGPLHLMRPDRHELAKGKACQVEAQDAFDRDDFYTAYQLYAEAEVHYRKAYSKPGDRQYFMQLSAIRCLEYSLEDRPGLIAQYRAEAQRFLSEWTPDKITIAISYRRISEALVFREFRKTTWEGVGSSAFREANLAIEAEDFERARVLLDECIARYAGSSNPERDAIVAIARCKQEISVARLEVKRRRFNRDLKKIASAYLRAARASALPAGTLSKQRDRIASYRALALSDALKYRAASRLRPRTNTIIATQSCPI